jgi:hypothetical protein
MTATGDEGGRAFFVARYRGQPDRSAIRCPACAKEAVFESGYLAYDALPASIDAGSAIHWNQRVIIERYPGQLRWADPANPAWKDRPARADMNPGPGETAVLGIVNCPACGLRRRHLLRWPQDAFYQGDVRGETLWGWTRAHLVAIRDYVASDQRVDAPGAMPVGKLPSHFLTAKHRPHVLKAIDRLLREV